jgi:hypothetical protein
MGVGFGDIGPGLWALMLAAYGADKVRELEREIEKGALSTIHEIDAWLKRQPVADDRWDPRTNPMP